MALPKCDADYRADVVRRVPSIVMAFAVFVHTELNANGQAKPQELPKIEIQLPILPPQAAKLKSDAAIDGVFQINGIVQEDLQLQRRNQIQMFMRGLIQNELSIIDRIVDLNTTQKQRLVDLAEEQWREKTKPSLDKSLQQHLWGNIDLDGLSERLVRAWLASVADDAQLKSYDAELADRMLYRKQAFISRWLDIHQIRLNLSSKQMHEIESVLGKNWRDRWFRSLEATFGNNSLWPDISMLLISPFLSDAQNAALVVRDTQATYRSFDLTGDCPTIDLTERFAMGNIKSSDSIDLLPKKIPGLGFKVDEVDNALKQ